MIIWRQQMCGMKRDEKEEEINETWEKPSQIHTNKGNMCKNNSLRSLITEVKKNSIWRWDHPSVITFRALPT